MNLIIIILKAMAIGVLGSVPVGPIVMLSVRRSILNGQKAGMRCALGAVLSDTVFAAMALFAATATSVLLENYFSIIQVCGGIIIAAIGAGMVLSKEDAPDRQSPYRHSMRETGKSVAMGFTNPGSFFGILAALTATGMTSDNMTVAGSVCVVSGVFAGSLLYWLVLTYFASKKGSGFNTSALRMINRLFGAAILLFGLYFLVRGTIKLL